jgi:hypothetical protein
VTADNSIVRDLFGEATEDETRIAAKGQQSESTLVGRYAEFMVCAYLSRLGYNVHHVDAAGFDLILEHSSGSYRIDVKSSTQTYIGPRKEMAVWTVPKSHWIQGKAKKNYRWMTPDDCDILALFHRTFETVVYYPVVKPIHDVRLPISQVRNNDYGEASLKAAIVAKSKSGTAWR